MHISPKIKILILVVVGLCTAAYLLSTYTYRSKADENTRTLSFGTTNSNADRLMLEMGISLTDMTDTAQIDSFLQTFRGTSVFVRIVNPQPSIVSDPNFIRIQNEGHFWYFSAASYPELTSIAQAYFTAYPTGRAILELTNHDARDAAQTQTLTAAFPSARFVASGFTNWNREKTHELVNTSVAGHLTSPSLHSVSFYADMTQATGNVAENIALFWDTFFDASNDIAGTSIKVDWPANTPYSLALSEIKANRRTTPEDILRDESRKLGILLTAFFDYAQARGDESRTTSRNKPIRYAGLGDYSLLSANARSIARIFALMAKDQMLVVYPSTSSGINLRDHKPLFGLVGHTEANGYRMVLVNGDNNPITVQLPDAFPLSGYTSISTVRGDTYVVTNTQRITFAPYEVVALYKTSTDTPTATPPPSQATSTPTPTSVPAGATTTPTPTTTLTLTPTPLNTITVTMTMTPSPSPTLTVTPSPSRTATPTPTVLPTVTPIAAPFCDPAGCGVCGWRNMQGVCVTSGNKPDGTSCCYSTCIQSSCKRVSGYGVDACTSDAGCIATPTPQEVRVIITATPKSSAVASTQSPIATAVPTVYADNRPAPPVSGNWSGTAILVGSAVVIVLIAFIL